MARLRIHPDYWPVIAITAALVLLDVLAFVFISMAMAKPTGMWAGPPPIGGSWWVFGLILMVEPSWLIPLLWYTTSKSIAAGKRALRAAAA